MNLKHQIFTPKKIVEKMLNSVNYCKNLYGKKILESSSGDGSILLNIVERYIISSIKDNYSLDEIKVGLEQDIYAVEIDTFYYKECIKKLNELAHGYGINKVQWNLFNCDRLDKKFKIKFDFIIGNPPYIKYHDIEKTNRGFLKSKYKSCSKGNFDYYYAFLEEDLDSLNETGKISYLVPSNMFKNVHGNIIRELIKDKLIAVYDYTNEKIFQNILTSSSIIIIDKSVCVNHINYHDIKKKSTIIISKNLLKEKWVFRSHINHNENTLRFGNYFEASMPVATLLNEAFILRDFEESGDYYKVNQKKIEKCLVRDAASPKNMYLQRKEKIIFPYFYNSQGLNRYTPTEFANLFPSASEYLQMFSHKLSSRNSSSNVFWFEYGRTQALKHLNQPKLLISTIITKKVKIYELNQNTIPYSGIYIVPKQNMSLAIAKDILQTKEFFEYVTSVGTNVNSSSVRITAKDINNYFINENLI
ncbi:N-6 DNA Methylase [Desemzia incerta]|uniref:site-specific DNA-methyltransferase (adenine-specific) n=1 Tax=Desemzia incerta TaxID=82801 RepID=A0A1I5UV33_9LACT|nr:N-6 DNA methylase [Desemzia incerta]SFP99058.1 N-6 DNA Methylase [Desemzia incerta]